MPLQATSGAASYDAFGGGVAAVPNYIEDVFSSYLWTTSGSDQTLTTGIDMTKGALTWIKSRSNAFPHILQTGIGGGVLPNNALSTNSTAAYAGGNYRIADSTTGFTMGVDYYTGTPQTAVVWTFRKQPKFFDVVTFTGTQNSSGTGQVVSHNLGSTPGCVIIKPITDTSGTGFSIADWIVWHRSLPSNSVFLKLNSSASQNGNSDKIQAVSSTTFTAGWEVGYTGQQYVAYLFAHDAGGFGLTGTDNVISCGSFSGNTTVTLGYEPQWIMLKRTDAVGNWDMHDVMRGWPVSGDAARLRANLSDAESQTSQIYPNATGFSTLIGAGNYIYIAIRRGPMKVPTSGTSVYNNLANRVGTSATATISGVGFPVDLMLPFNETSGSVKPFVDRLRGATKYLLPPYSNAEQTETNVVTSFASNDGVIVGADSLDVINNYYNGDRRYAASFFRRAPSFFDEVCYTGTEVSGQTFNHNLGAMPEMMIVKARSGTTDWTVYHSALGASARIYLNATNAANTGTAAPWNSTAPTSTVFSLGDAGATNLSGTTFVNYLFATCAGVSKVGSYTGTGGAQTINCGFTSGARFILIKRTDSTGDWYMYDSARGISASSDPYLLLNTTGASELGTNYVDTDSTGFKVTAAAPAALNANGGSFIFLAIA